MCPTMVVVGDTEMAVCNTLPGKVVPITKDVTACSSSGLACRSHSVSSSEENSPVCWICLDGHHSDATLLQPCKCPRHAHDRCLARWQLQSAGSRKETHCEFCDRRLPDWKGALTPVCGADAPAVMNVNFDGRTYSFEVKPGLKGYQEFTEAIRRAFSLPDDSELNITFTCDEPSTGWPAEVPIQAPSLVHASSLLTLQGAGAYDAAVHCASVSAARRILQNRDSSSSLSYSGSYLSSQFSNLSELGLHSSPSSPARASSSSSSSSSLSMRNPAVKRTGSSFRNRLIRMKDRAVEMVVGKISPM